MTSPDPTGSVDRFLNSTKIFATIKQPGTRVGTFNEHMDEIKCGRDPNGRPKTKNWDFLHKQWFINLD